MSTPIHGYLIVDKKTGAPDWDAEVHPTAHAAIESLCNNWSFCRAEEATDDGPTYWAEVYDIHPVGPALDPEYAAALADPEGRALVKAIHDRKRICDDPADDR